MSGRLDENKTYHEILFIFYWPGLKSVVSKQCKSSHTCQPDKPVICALTRFTEAIPPRNISTKAIVKALVKLLRFVGLTKSIQSDQGLNFMSGISEQVIH